MLQLAICIVIAVCDQISKFLILTRVLPGEDIPVIDSFFSITFGKNTGAAWGIMQGFNDWLVILSMFVVISLLIFRRHFFENTVVHRVTLGLMAGGILGNLIDRIKHGYVIDFLDFYNCTYHFPAFNIADSAICIGVALYIISVYVAEHKKLKSGKNVDKPVKSQV